MKTLKRCSILAAVAVILMPMGVVASGNKYEVFAKTLMPFVNLFAKKTRDPNRALSLNLRLEQMTGMPPALAGAHASVQVEYPDKVRISGPVLGEELTICRNGQELWVFPGSKAAVLLKTATLPPPDPKFRLGEFRLPIPEKQLVFLPALFSVGDEGEEQLDGVNCRVLDLHLMPELAKAVGAAGWSVRAWINPKSQPARIILKRDGWELSVRVDEVRFAPSLAESTWKPTPEQSADVLKIAPEQYQQLLKLIGGERE